MKQIPLSFMRPDLEAIRQEIDHAEDVIEEQAGGPLKNDNERRLDRCRQVLDSAEQNSYLGYPVKSEIELIRHLISLIYQNRQ